MQGLEIKICGEPKEIAALALAVQERLGEIRDPLERVSPQEAVCKAVMEEITRSLQAAASSAHIPES